MTTRHQQEHEEEQRPRRRMTLQTRRVLTAMRGAGARPQAVQRAGEWYCLELAGRAGLEPSTTYQVLHRLQRHGFVQSRWEDIDPHTAARPRRCYWRLTPDGAALADTAPADPGFTNPEFTNAGFTNAVPEGSA